MKHDETVEEYSDRLDAITERIADACEGEQADELVLVLSRMIFVVLDTMPGKQRKAMAHVLKEYVRVSTEEDEPTIN